MYVRRFLLFHDNQPPNGVYKMFNQVRYEHNPDKNIYTFYGNFGTRFKHFLERKIITKKKLKALVISINHRTIVINGFFLIELRYVIWWAIEYGNEYDVNMVALTSLLKILDEEILVSDRVGSVTIDENLIKETMKFTPLPTQRTAYKTYLEVRNSRHYRGMLIEGGIGVGKTFISLSMAVGLRSDVTVIVAPKNTIDKVWKHSISDPEGSLFKVPPKLVYVDKNSVYSGERYVLCHYQTIKIAEDFVRKYNINVTTVIVDEVHNLNNIEAKMTKELISLVNLIDPKHVLLLSGTPIIGKVKELVPLFRLLDKSFTKSVERRAIALYRNTSGPFSKSLPAKYKKYSAVIPKSTLKLKPLKTIIHKVTLKNGDYYTLEAIRGRFREYVKNRYEELTRDLDIYKNRYYGLVKEVREAIAGTNVVSKKEFQEYEDNVAKIIKHYDNNTLSSIPDTIKAANRFEREIIMPHLSPDNKVIFQEAKTIVKYMSLKLQGEALGNVVMRARIDCYTDLARAIEYNKILNSTVKKTLVFSSYIEVCQASYEANIKLGNQPVPVFGEHVKNLTYSVNKLRNVPEANPLIATYKALSTGVPLTMANVIIILGYPFRQAIYEQTIGRAWRLGQDKQVTVYIIELSTKDVNITDRDTEIIEFFQNEVERITGKTDSMKLRGEIVDINISNEDDIYGYQDILDIEQPKPMKISKTIDW